MHMSFCWFCRDAAQLFYVVAMIFQPTEFVDMPIISNKETVSREILGKIDVIKQQTEVRGNLR